MKKINFRKTLTVFALMLALLFATVFTSCGKGPGENSVGENDNHTLAEAVTEFAGRSEIYANGTVRTDTLNTVITGSEKETASSTTNLVFAGGISYDEATGKFGAFDADVFSLMTSPVENSAALTNAGAMFIRDGLSYSYNGLSDYSGTANGIKDAVSEKLKAGDKLNILSEENLKDVVLKKLGLDGVPTTQVKEIEAAVKSVYSGIFKGVSEFAVITRTGDDYTLDVTATICGLIDKCAVAAEAALKHPDATVGEFYAMPEIKAILSPILKNVKAKDVVDVLKTAIGEEYFHETAEGKLEVVVSGVGSIVIDKPDATTTLEDYLVNTVFEAGLNTGAAVIKIKDFKIGTIFGFGGGSENDSQSSAMTEEEIAATVAEIKKSKDEILEVLPTAKITLTIKSGKITHIKAEIKTVESGTINNGTPEDMTSYSYKNEKTVIVEFDVPDKMPALLDISKAEIEKTTTD